MKLLLSASLVGSFFLLILALVLLDRKAKKLRTYLIFSAIGSYLLLITAFYISDM